VVTASRDETARLWDLASGKQIGEPLRHEEAAVTCAQFSPDGQRVVTASLDKTARLWNVASGEQIGEPMKHEDAVNSAQFSPDGRWVVTASRDKTARLWDAASGEQIRELPRRIGPHGCGMFRQLATMTARTCCSSLIWPKLAAVSY
jgi:WD40 repeat protein